MDLSVRILSRPIANLPTTFEPGMLHVAAHVEDEVRIDLDNDLLTSINGKLLFNMCLFHFSATIVRA